MIRCVKGEEIGMPEERATVRLKELDLRIRELRLENQQALIGRIDGLIRGPRNNEPAS